jgi:integrase
MEASKAVEKAKPKRTYGTGSVYLREGSRVYMMAYKSGGKLIRESTGETSVKKARDVLAQRIAEVRTGKYTSPTVERVTVQELATDVLEDFIIQGHKDTVNPTIRWQQHLKPVFGHLKAKEVTRPMIDKYVSDRLKAKAANASCNRELAFLKRCFKLGFEHEKVYRVPSFPHLEENNTREGFPTDEQFEKLKTACAREGLWMRAMLELAATFGWRKGSLLKMTAGNVDIVNGTVRQEGSTTKSGDANECKMTNGLNTLLTACAVDKDSDRWLFSRDKDGFRPIRDFRRTWRKVTKEAGCPNLLFHDLCRFSARNLDAAGVSQKVSMAVMGRKTDSIFKRYDIVDRRDVDRAIDRLDTARQEASQRTIESQSKGQKSQNQIDSHFESQVTN